ncbi:MAG: hypothetical protein M1832_001908 [Thelocarpon impressellum]|nr:MAG: hypothetical protein M1832_001908 [Thelocarpon impressellum]
MVEVVSNLAYHERFERLKQSESAKDALIEELLIKLDALNEEYRTACLDRRREVQFNREMQLKETEYESEIRRTKKIMDSNPFILVLIDGDGMIFQDHLLQNGEQGGKEASGLLASAIRDYVEREVEDLGSDYKIVARIYANTKGLADTCFRAGIVDKPSKVEEFARGFTQSKHLFDFIDVGSGKERADSKVSEILKLHLFDCHCRQILFGCSHDNGYAPVLEEYTTDKAYAGRISLIEGTPFEKELVKLAPYFKATKLERVFRSSKIVVQPPQQQLQQLQQQQQQLQQRQLAFLQQTQAQQIVYQSPHIARTVSSSTTNSSAGSVSTGPLSWVSAATTLSGSPPPTPKATKAAPNEIPRNRSGQRVDPDVKYDRYDIKRVKALKMCNVHFLRGDCGYGSDCTHSHSHKPTSSEMGTLKQIARLAPCRMGSDCSDPRCIYGHRCPAGTPCPYGAECKFPSSMHNFDTTVVRSIKV